MAMALKRNLFIVFIVIRWGINDRSFTMGKKQIMIEEYRNIAKSHTITVYNARCQKGFYSDIEKMLKDFFKSEELFFGFYRTDGLNITSKRTEDLKEEISNFFSKYGVIECLDDYLSVAKIKANDGVWSFLPFVLDYYLDTVLFSPKISWEAFIRYYSEYLKHRVDELINNDFADLLFFYFDSGDFSICFDPAKYPSDSVKKTIFKFFPKF